MKRTTKKESEPMVRRTKAEEEREQRENRRLACLAELEEFREAAFKRSVIYEGSLSRLTSMVPRLGEVWKFVRFTVTYVGDRTAKLEAEPIVLEDGPPEYLESLVAKGAGNWPSLEELKAYARGYEYASRELDEVREELRRVRQRFTDGAFGLHPFFGPRF